MIYCLVYTPYLRECARDGKCSNIWSNRKLHVYKLFIHFIFFFLYLVMKPHVCTLSIHAISSILYLVKKHHVFSFTLSIHFIFFILYLVKKTSCLHANHTCYILHCLSSQETCMFTHSPYILYPPFFT